MLRILHLIDTLAAGGAERQLVYLLENLDRQRFEPLVVTIYDEHHHYEPTLRALGIPLYSLHHGSLKPQNRVWALGRYLRLMWALRPAIVHSWLHYANLIARCARPLCPSHRLITAIRSQYTIRQRQSERLTARLSDFRIVNNETLNLGLFEWNNTLFIPNGIPTHHFNTVTSEKPFAGNHFTLLLVARIDPNKGHITLIKALAALREELPPQFQAIFIGEVTSTLTQQALEEAVVQHQLQNIIHQLPSTHQIAPYYQFADLVILPSDSEAFPNVVLESLASGKPMIISEAANMQNLIVHGENGWVFPPGDAKALAKCLRQALALSADELAQMGQRGQARMAEYTVERMADRYQRLYEELATRS